MKNRTEQSLQREKEAKGKLRKFIIRNKLDKVFVISVLPTTILISFLRTKYPEIPLEIYPLYLVIVYFLFLWWNGKTFALLLRAFWKDENFFKLEEEEKKMGG